jgi:glycosyltransferase involved in cell wall biosynthesis
MPVKNGELFLTHSLTDLRSNCGPGDEIILIDDNSSDDTLNKLLTIAKADKRIFVTRNRGNGIVDALNFGLELASKDWVARFDVDDLYPIDRIKKQRALLNSDVAIVFSDYQFFTDDGQILGTIPSSIFKESSYISLISGQRTAHSSALFSREFALSVGGYLHNEFPAEDLGLWLRMSRFGNIITVPEVLLKYRLSTTSVTISSNRDSINKRRQLQANYRFDFVKIENCLVKSSEIYREYRNYSHAQTRRILFIRDLLLLRKFQSSIPRLNRVIVLLSIRAICNINSYRNLIQLWREKKGRRNFRNRTIPSDY